MADKRIQDLTPASSVQLNDLFVLEQSGAAKNLTGQILVNDLAAYLDGHGGIANIVYAPPVAPSLNGTMTIIMADQTEYTLTVTNGNGITGITWQESGTPGDGQTHTGTIRYTNGTTSTVVINDGLRGYTGAQTYVWFKWSQNYPTQDSDLQNNVAPYIGIYAGTSSTVPTTYTSYVWYQYKGEKGDTGDSVESIQKTGTSGLVDTYTVYLTGGVAVGTFTVTNAKSIASLVQTSGTHAAGTTDTYTMTFNDGDSATISVYNGANGLGAVSTVSGIQADGNGDVPQVVSGNGAPTAATEGQENQLYYDLNSGSMYYCAGESQGSYIWLGATVTVDSALSNSSTNPVQNKVITGKVGTQALNTTATDLSGAVNEILTEIPSPQTSGTPSNLGTASRGSALTYSRSDHVHNLPSGLVPSGGATGQFLAKSSGSDYALTWNTAPVTSVNGQTGAVTVPTPTYNQTNVTSGTHDLNDYTTPGLYYFSSGATLSNAPNSAVNGWLWVLAANNNVRKQIWVRHGSNPSTTKDFYMRLVSGGTWGDWFSESPYPTIVEDVWDTTQGGAANFESTATFEVSGQGFVLVQDNTWIEPLSASDYGSSNVTITYNGAVVASAGVRTTSSHSEMQGAYVEYPANVSNGDTFVLNERHTKGGTKHVRRRFVCFGCTVTKTA